MSAAWHVRGRWQSGRLRSERALSTTRELGADNTHPATGLMEAALLMTSPVTGSMTSSSDDFKAQSERLADCLVRAEKTMLGEQRAGSAALVWH